MPTTKENLETAFAGESQANRKYLAYARQAEKEGLTQIAKLFRATAEAETIHALAHFNNLGGIGKTLENLEHAVEGETYEFKDMYPPMLKQAEEENHKAKMGFNFALQAEKVHARIYAKALETLRAGGDLAAMDIYLCPICGDIELGVLPDKCPICGVASSKFQKIS